MYDHDNAIYARAQIASSFRLPRPACDIQRRVPRRLIRADAHFVRVPQEQAPLLLTRRVGIVVEVQDFALVAPQRFQRADRVRTAEAAQRSIIAAIPFAIADGEHRMPPPAPPKVDVDLMHRQRLWIEHRQQPPAVRHPHLMRDAHPAAFMLQRAQIFGRAHEIFPLPERLVLERKCSLDLEQL